MRRCAIYRPSRRQRRICLNPCRHAVQGIPWREIRGFRNILVHNYLGDIDPETVAAVVDTHLQPLEDCIQEMLAAEEG